jgi:hypothetical protein
LAQCLKQVICDFLRCTHEAFCPDGDFKVPPQGAGQALRDCLGHAACSALECIPDALCGPKGQLPPKQDDLPCNFAVEDSTS